MVASQFAATMSDSSKTADTRSAEMVSSSSAGDAQSAVAALGSADRIGDLDDRAMIPGSPPHDNARSSRRSAIASTIASGGDFDSSRRNHEDKMNHLDVLMCQREESRRCATGDELEQRQRTVLISTGTVVLQTVHSFAHPRGNDRETDSRLMTSSKKQVQNNVDEDEKKQNEEGRKNASTTFSPHDEEDGKHASSSSSSSPHHQQNYRTSFSSTSSPSSISTTAAPRQRQPLRVLVTSSTNEDDETGMMDVEQGGASPPSSSSSSAGDESHPPYSDDPEELLRRKKELNKLRWKRWWEKNRESYNARRRVAFKDSNQDTTTKDGGNGRRRAPLQRSSSSSQDPRDARQGTSDFETSNKRFQAQNETEAEYRANVGQPERVRNEGFDGEAEARGSDLSAASTEGSGFFPSSSSGYMVYYPSSSVAAIPRQPYPSTINALHRGSRSVPASPIISRRQLPGHAVNRDVSATSRLHGLDRSAAAYLVQTPEQVTYVQQLEQPHPVDFMMAAGTSPRLVQPTMAFQGRSLSAPSQHPAPQRQQRFSTNASSRYQVGFGAPQMQPVMMPSLRHQQQQQQADEYAARGLVPSVMSASSMSMDGMTSHYLPPQPRLVAIPPVTIFQPLPSPVGISVATSSAGLPILVPLMAPNDLSLAHARNTLEPASAGTMLPQPLSQQDASIVGRFRGMNPKLSPQ